MSFLISPITRVALSTLISFSFNTNDTKLASGITIDSTDSATMEDVVTDENGQILRGEEAKEFLESGMNWFQKIIHNIGEWLSNVHIFPLNLEPFLVEYHLMLCYNY